MGHARGDARGDAPLDFQWNYEENCYTVKWGNAGDLSRRFVIMPPKATEPFPKELPADELTKIPANALLVYSYHIPQLHKPEGCTQLNEALLDTVEEQTGADWLPHGRIALIAGLLKGTVPPDCCSQPFSSQKLGLHYQGTGVKPYMVQVDDQTGGVRIVGGVAERCEGRFRAYDDEAKPLIQKPHIARLWDECARSSPDTYIERRFSNRCLTKHHGTAHQEALCTHKGNPRCLNRSLATIWTDREIQPSLPC